MTFHTKRTSPGRGALLKRRIKTGGLVMVSTRLTIDDAEAFASAAEARRVPMARVIREALRAWLDAPPNRTELP